MLSQALTEIYLPEAKLFKRGKVREVFDFGKELLIVASDRISAFDVVMPNGIPDKGKILTQISNFWFDLTKIIIDNHLISQDVRRLPKEFLRYQPMLDKRSVLVKKTNLIPVECIARGYISGSGWTEYKQSGSICGIRLPPGLKESDKLPEPIFTPTHKADAGHDLPMTESELVDAIGVEKSEFLKTKTLQIYKKASEYALKKGIIIADTKLEFGEVDGKIILIDEILTPDSSRFWPVDKYKPGQPQFSFDKQYLRDYLLSVKWNKEPPAPVLPEEVIEKTRHKYLEAYFKITGREKI